MKDEGTNEAYRTYDCEKPMLGHFETKYNKDGKQYEEFVTDDAKLFHNFLVPKKVDWDDKLEDCKRRIVDFACGDSHLLVVARDENTFGTRVYSAGRNHTGQLGMGDQMHRHVLTPIKALDKKNICKVAAGSFHSFALSMFGDILYAWGSSKDGVLGLFDAEHEHMRSPRVFSLPMPVLFPQSLRGARIVDIVAGDNTAFAITNQHNVYAWGFNVYGQTGISCTVLEVIGRPRKLDPMETVQVGNPEATKCWVLRAAAGGQHSLLLLKRFK
jgi:alpha-tubulin suppressor-like RCC1 family protein